MMGFSGSAGGKHVEGEKIDSTVFVDDDALYKYDHLGFIGFDLGTGVAYHVAKRFGQVSLHEASRITSSVPSSPTELWAMAFPVHHQLDRLQAGEPP